MNPDQHDQHGRVLLALDVDGVLLDAGRGGRGPWQVSFGERFGVDPRRLNDTLFAALWPDVITGRRPVEAALAETLTALGWDMGVEAALQCWFEEDFVVDPAVVAAATQWSDHGVPLALVSNQEPRRARDLEQRLAPLLPPFATAFSGDLGAVKGDRDFYSRAERHIGLEPGAPVVFLDDTPANVEVASAHGWTGVHFTKDGEWHQRISAALEGRPGDVTPA
jgi:HAD superfamily hydrolase (TIGR01509 family)